MTDELKDKLQQLVADPPPPTGVPSEAVFAKVRTVRRRRTAGVATLAAAAVVAIAVAAGNLTDIDASPPVSNQPNAATTVVAAPSTSPVAQSTPSTSGPGSPSTSGKAVTPSTPVHSSPVTPVTQQPPALGVNVILKPKVSGRSMTMTVTLKGTLVSPLAEGKSLPSDTSFLNRSLGTQYTFGDSQQSGSDGGAVTCIGAKKRITGQETYTLLDGPHVYTKAGTYTFKYTVMYCGANGPVQVVKTTRIVIR